MMMRPGDILGRIFFILSQKSIIGSSGFIHGAHGGHGSSEIIHGIILEVASQEIYPITWELKSLNKNPKQNALEYLAFGKGFIGDRLTARHLN